MNCRPGDIAVTTHPTLTTLVAVMYAAPVDDFILPDGHKALRQTAGPAWVCEAMGSLFPVLAWEKGISRPALRRYAVIADRGGERWARAPRGSLSHGHARIGPPHCGQPLSLGSVRESA